MKVSSFETVIRILNEAGVRYLVVGGIAVWRCSQADTFDRRKGMVILQFYSDQHRETPLDVFVREPFDVDKELEDSFRQEISPGLVVPIVSLQTLIRLKNEVGRPKDQEDVRRLTWKLEASDQHSG